MTSRLALLLRVKTMKEERALREALARREAARAAAAATQEAGARRRDSADALPAKEDAVYRAILGRIVDCAAIEAAKGRVAQLEKEHERVVDAHERALHLQAEAEANRDAAVARHRASARAREKYALLTERERAAREAETQAAEEIEIEDLFGTKRRSRSWR